MKKNLAKQYRSVAVHDDEKKSQETESLSTGNKVAPKLNFHSESHDAFRSTMTMSSNTRGGFGKIEFGGVQPAPFLQSKNDPNTSNESVFALPIPGFSKGLTAQKTELETIDICSKDMELCGMKPCQVFVACATLEPLDDDIELFVPGLVREEKKEESSTESEDWPQSLKVNESCCVVSNTIEECAELVPLSLARVSDDMDLQLQSDDNNDSTHIPHIKGCVMIQHKPIAFAVHFYTCPEDKSATVVEFQRRSGDGFAFQKFYKQCLEKLKEDMTKLRNCSLVDDLDDSSALSSLIGLTFDGLSSDTCFWDDGCLDLLAGLIEDGSDEAVNMLGNLCEEMERHVTLRVKVLKHEALMEQLVTRVLTHQDQCFVRLGLVALHIGLGDGQKSELIKNFLQSHHTLAFIIALLNSASMFVLRRTVRLLSLLASKCGCPWKLSDAQKQILIERVPIVQKSLLDNRTWSATYATTSFITTEMFQDIYLHPTL